MVNGETQLGYVMLTNLARTKVNLRDVKLLTLKDLLALRLFAKSVVTLVNP